MDANKESLIRGETAAKQYTEKIMNHNGIKLDSLRQKGFEDIRNQIILELRQNSDLGKKNCIAPHDKWSYGAAYQNVTKNRPLHPDTHVINCAFPVKTTTIEEVEKV